MTNRSNATIDERLTAAQVALDNALNDSGLQDSLAVFGYTAERLQEGQALYETARSLHDQQQAEYGDQFAATDALQSAWDEAKTVYTRHVKVARVALKRERGAWKQLGLSGRRKRTLSGWLTQARQFYANALADPNILVELGNFGITQEKLEAGQTLVDDVETANAAQEQEKGEAQEATRKRDQALDALDEWMSDFVAIARVALEDRPQHLEKLGVVAPS